MVIARVLRLILDAAGYEVRSADTLAAARSLLLAGPPPDLVLLDLVLPDGEALDLCREVKAAHASLPVLVLTGRAEPSARERAIAAGADAVITKPFTLEELEAEVARLLADPAAAPQPM